MFCVLKNKNITYFFLQLILLIDIKSIISQILVKNDEFSFDIESTGGRHVCRFINLVNIRWKMQSLCTCSLQAD